VNMVPLSKLEEYLSTKPKQITEGNTEPQQSNKKLIELTQKGGGNS